MLAPLRFSRHLWWSRLSRLRDDLSRLQHVNNILIIIIKISKMNIIDKKWRSNETVEV